MQFLWLIFILVTASHFVLFLTHSLLHPSVHCIHVIMPSFCWKYCKQTKKKTPNHLNFGAAQWATLPRKHFRVDFLGFFSSTEPQSCDNAVHEDVPLVLMTWRWKNWWQYSWAPDWVVKVSFVPQTSWQMTVRCDRGCGMWHALWKQRFYLKKKKTQNTNERHGSLGPVTCPGRGPRWHRPRAGSPPPPPPPPLRPAHPGGFRWTPSLECTASWSRCS